MCKTFFPSVDPNFYSMNLAMLGKTYVRMGKNDDARSFLIRVQDHSVRTVDDKKVRISLQTFFGLKNSFSVLFKVSTDDQIKIEFHYF